jgi:peptide/nickel transport system substrate-binding protein/microcin C transport system substrate-binding protein
MKMQMVVFYWLCFVGVMMGVSSLYASPVKEALVLGNPKAPKQGTFQLNLSSEPTSLHPLSAPDAYASEVQGWVIESLMSVNVDTYELDPALAERYEISKDEKSFTFYLRKNAKWHDGKPLTAEDVKFSFDAVRDPKYNAVHLIPYFENLESCEVVDKHTVRFMVKRPYFNNFRIAATMQVVPKHYYKDPKKKRNKTLLGSGPYKLSKYKKGKSIALERNKDWWGVQIPQLAGRYNPDKILFRFIGEDNVRLEMLKKGRLDMMVLNAEQYVRKAQGKPWGTEVLKKKVQHKGPRGFGFIAWNFKEDLFQDRDGRVALAHLMNRELMNKKFRYGMSLLATGPWYRQSPYADPSVQPIGYDREKARKLLKKAGWTDSDKNGVLDKTVKGKKKEFRFTLLYPTREVEKYFTLYKEDLKKAGIDMNLKVVEWNSFIKALEDRKFEAVSLAWGSGSVDNDPKQIWHSQSSRKGGSNFNSYSNPKVDKLIDKGRAIMDRDKRIEVYKEIYREIAKDAPYAFLFNENYTMYGVNKKVKSVKDTFEYGIGQEYMWIEK